MKINDIHSKMLRWDTILSAELAHGKFGLSVHGSYLDSIMWLKPMRHSIYNFPQTVNAIQYFNVCTNLATTFSRKVINTFEHDFQRTVMKSLIGLFYVVLEKKQSRYDEMSLKSFEITFFFILINKHQFLAVCTYQLYDSMH